MMIWLLVLRLPDPQLVGTFLVPGHAALGAVDFQAQAVLAARRYLAGREGSARALAHAEHHGAEIFRVDLHFLVIFRLQRFPGEGLDRALGLLARLVERLQVGAHDW